MDIFLKKGEVKCAVFELKCSADYVSIKKNKKNFSIKIAFQKLFRPFENSSIIDENNFRSSIVNHFFSSSIGAYHRNYSADLHQIS